MTGQHFQGFPSRACVWLCVATAIASHVTGQHFRRISTGACIWSCCCLGNFHSDRPYFQQGNGPCVFKRSFFTSVFTLRVTRSFRYEIDIDSLLLVPHRWHAAWCLMKISGIWQLMRVTARELPLQLGRLLLTSLEVPPMPQEFHEKGHGP